MSSVENRRYTIKISRTLVKLQVVLKGKYFDRNFLSAIGNLNLRKCYVNISQNNVSILPSI